MKEIIVTAPDGYEIDKEKSTFEKIVFKEIVKRIKWEDFGSIKGYYVNACGAIIPFTDVQTNYSNANTWPTKEEAEACLALSQLCQWKDRYNEGWRPDWNNGTVKYVIYISGDVVFTSNSIFTQNLLSFKTCEVRDRFLKDFKDLIEIAKPLL